ncbi:MAG: hypothetical protein BWX51_01070 [Bacteroidetes bacterium ADurb.Bin012]|jgi:hypothetical protein|nr:MAG: hypothetical protein BWX51_01070 [Bacteroidetes bacterium ADurb.Bin012]
MSREKNKSQKRREVKGIVNRVWKIQDMSDLLYQIHKLFFNIARTIFKCDGFFYI